MHILLDGKKVFHGMPKRAFMAMCKEGQDAIAANPKAEAVSYKSDQIQRKALFRIFDYMKGNCFTAKPFVLKPDSNMLDSLELYRAGRLFFKSDQYLQGLYHHIHRYLEDGTMPSFGELEVICKLKDAFNHKVYNFAVVVIASYRFQGMIADQDAFESWLEKHPGFAKSMDDYAAKKQAQKDQRRSEHQNRLQVTRKNSRVRRNPDSFLPAASPVPTHVEVRDLRKPSTRKGYKQGAKKDTNANADPQKTE